MGSDESIQLRAAASALVADPPPGLDPRVQRIASTPTQQWTTEMTAAAQDLLAAYPHPARTSATTPPASSIARTQGPQSKPAAPAAYPAPPTATPAKEPPGPFVYDHSIDGLRGIPLTDLAAVNSKLAERMATFGLESVYDLLTHVPRRYLDRSVTEPIDELVVGATGTCLARVTSSEPTTVGNGMKVAKIRVSDDTGTIDCTFFNSPWKAHVIRAGQEVVIQGRLDEWITDSGTRYLQMKNPLMDRTGNETAPIVPIYPQSAKTNRVTTWDLHRASMEAVQRMGDLADPIPADLVRGGPNLMSRAAAYRLVHCPESSGQETAARDRLAYDELFRMQLALRMHRLAEQAHGGIIHSPTSVLTRQLLNQLPFPLTQAQVRALTIIAADLRAGQPMHRLLQGDVGAGKTLIALMTLLMAVEGGYQGALMAPTEVLATQHYSELVERLAKVTRADGTPLRVETLTNKVRTKARREMLADLAAGKVDLLVGTHALLSDDVNFARLGVAVVDEQHRFGVEQRAELGRKGGDLRPDVLVMTATPIPRAAAMTVFGDLDVAVLDELPPGRIPIDTDWEPRLPDMSDPDDPVWRQVIDQVGDGRQAYVVCPLIEDSETKAAASAESTREALTAGALEGLQVRTVHGKMKPDERDQVMAAFKAGTVDVLVATTVIEVGVNMPNAAIIVILDPKSFGMAQLHQLRGRVGRGQHASKCILAGEAGSSDTARRLEALVGSTDGFVLSEIDLDLRGAGSILGSRQSGLSDLRVASLTDDRLLLEMARDDAAALLDSDPQLGRWPQLRSETRSALGPNAERWLTSS